MGSVGKRVLVGCSATCLFHWGMVVFCGGGEGAGMKGHEMYKPQRPGTWRQRKPAEARVSVSTGARCQLFWLPDLFLVSVFTWHVLRCRGPGESLQF